MKIEKPTIYLDKGVLGAINLHRLSEHFQICYSEATLLDLLNDQSGSRVYELRLLNEVNALYFFRESGQVCFNQSDAVELMERIDPFELEIMTHSYRFMNGGGTLNLFEILHHQLSTLLNLDDEIQNDCQNLLKTIDSDQSLEPLKNQNADSWRIEVQKATKSWSQEKEITLRSLFEQHPELFLALKDYFPEEVTNPEQMHLAAMLLGALQLGSDRGIVSPNNDRSSKAARNGYVDCLHIMFGLHCSFFLTSDKATLRRFRLLNDFWKFERKCGLVSKFV